MVVAAVVTWQSCHLWSISGVEFTDKSAASSRDITQWEKENYPYVLSDDIKSFLQVSNGLLLKWKIKYQGTARVIA